MIPMNIKSKAGFTLVELIVVIAILGILAGIAVPAYSGYIKKAKSAGDTQVLSAANTALAAAMTENGLDPDDADDYLTATAAAENPAVDGCTVTLAAKSGIGDTNTATANAIIADFAVYYGNSNIVFEYYNTVTSPGIKTDGTFAISE